MDKDELEKYAKRLRDRMGSAAGSKHRPKVGLAAIQAARRYKAALDAAAQARQELVAAAVGRAPDSQEALAALYHLADCFGLPRFRADDLGDEDGVDR
jgi:hypothetical protein